MKKINEMNRAIRIKRDQVSARLKIADPNDTPERLSRCLRSPTCEGKSAVTKATEGPYEKANAVISLPFPVAMQLARANAVLKLNAN